VLLVAALWYLFVHIKEITGEELDNCIIQ